MCGIAGKLWFDPARPADRDSVAAITAALAHRGPDGEGFAADGPLAFGHRRLAIVDLSERGRQPFTSTDGSCLLVCNGELYNHRELRAELGAAGHRFRGDSDNEVLLPLYQEHFEHEGPAFVNRLEGMYAFALWDGRARRLLLGRDRMGQKPIVYAQTPEGLVFASELAALARDALVDRTPDWHALSDYLSFRVVPHPATAYVGARKLPPGHVMVVEDGRATLTRTFRVAPGSDDVLAPSLPEAAEQVRERLLAAVRRRLMADVPLGAFLSGGLDSAAIVACMAQSGRVSTFTIGFGESDFDETAGARKVAALFGTDHHELVVRPDAIALLDEIVARHGEPFADGSSLPTFLVSRLARQHVKVVLTGDGGDESFAGYDRHRALLLSRRLDRPWAAPLRGAVRAAAALAGGAANGRGDGNGAAGAGSGGRGPATRLRRFAGALAASERRRNHLWRQALPDAVRDGLLTPEGRRRFGAPSFYGADVDLPLPLNEALVLDLERYLPDDILIKLDIASMACGLEARSPFMDRALVTYAASLPGRLKLGRRGGLAGGLTGGLVSKLVLREALAPLLPADLRTGRKRGFGAPLEHWLRGPLLGHARDVLLSSRARQRGLFRPEAVEALLEAHAEKRVAAHEPLFTLLVLERWFLKEENAT